MSKYRKQFTLAYYTYLNQGRLAIPYWEIGSDIVHKLPDDLMKSILQGKSITCFDDNESNRQGAAPIYDFHTINEGEYIYGQKSTMYRAGSKDCDALIDIDGLSPDYECECCRLSYDECLWLEYNT